MKTISILCVALSIFISCTTPNHLHDTGIYTIKERNGSVTEFYEVKGKYQIFSDTLKVNDKIVINVIKARPGRSSGNKSLIAKSDK